jgi:hypothetical protein
MRPGDVVRELIPPTFTPYTDYYVHEHPMQYCTRTHQSLVDEHDQLQLARARAFSLYPAISTASDALPRYDHMLDALHYSTMSIQSRPTHITWVDELSPNWSPPMGAASGEQATPTTDSIERDEPVATVEDAPPQGAGERITPSEALYNSVVAVEVCLELISRDWIGRIKDPEVYEKGIRAYSL